MRIKQKKVAGFNVISQYEKGVASRLVEATLHTSVHYWPTASGVGAEALLLLLHANQSGSLTKAVFYVAKTLEIFFVFNNFTVSVGFKLL